MASNFLRFISVCVLSLSAVQALAVSFDANKYDVYFGDINGDGVNDIYFHGKELLILLHGDIITPIVIQPQPSYALYAQEFLDIANINVTEGSSNTVTYLVQYNYYSDPELVEPALSDQDIVDQGLIQWAEGSDYFVADFNNDNNSDILLRTPEFERAYILAGSDGNNPPSLLVSYDGEHAEMINDPTRGMVISDASDDGYLDIVFPVDDEYLVDELILGGGTYKEFGFESVYSPALPTTLVGSSAGVFRVNESGAATYTLALSLPDGIAGVTPSVALSYSSQGSNSIAGQGWGISASSAVTRCHDTTFTDGHTKPTKLNAEDKFCLNGQRLMVVDGVYGAPGSEYKTEIDSYRFIYAVNGTTGNPAYFDVVGKDGTLRRYGATAESKVNLGGATLSWALSSTEDNMGNAVNYHYSGGKENHQLDEISYAAGVAKINFYYADRPDVKVGYMNGHRLVSNKRLDRIEVSDSGDVFREYRLTYLKVTADNRVSRLHRIQECADIGANCLAPLEFEWQTQLLGVADTPMEFTPAVGDKQHLLTFKPADINGDGCHDIVYGWIQVHSSSYTSYKTSYSLSTDNCTAFLPIQEFATNVVSSANDSYQVEVLDYNSDGYSDIALRYSDTQDWKIYLSRPDADGNWRLLNDGFYSGTSGKFFIDVDSDGLVDNVSETEARLMKKLIEPNAATGSNYGFVGTKALGGEGDLKAFGDFNGDGSVDFIKRTLVNEGSNSTYRYSFWVQTPEGVELMDALDFTTITVGCDPFNYYECTPNVIAVNVGEILVADINSDGLSDVIFEVNNNYRLYINEGDGFAESQTLPLTSTELQVPGENFKLQPSLIDHNRDGYPDLYWHDRTNATLNVALWIAGEEVFGAPQVVQTEVEALSSYAFMDLNGDGARDLVEMVNAYEKDTDEDKSVKVFPSLDRRDHNLITAFSNGFGSTTTINYERMNISSHYTRTTVEAPGGIPNYFAEYNLCLDSISDSETTLHPSCKDIDYAFIFGLQSNPLNAEADSDEFYRAVFSVNSAMPIVASVESSAPIAGDFSNTSQVDYVYTDARIQAGGRGFLGFETLSTIDVQTGVITTTTYHQDFPFIGRPKSTAVKTSEGELLKYSSTEYSLNQPDNVSYYQPQPSSSTEVAYPTKTNTTQADGLEVGTEALSTTTVNTVFDTHGNLLSSESLFTSASPDPDTESGTLTLTQEKRTTNLYVGNDITLHGRTYSYEALGRLSSTESTGKRNSANQEPRSVAFSYYDNGMLYEEIIEPIDSSNSNPSLQELEQNLIKRSYYNAWGNLRKNELVAWNGESIETRGTEAVFDSTGRFVNETLDIFGNVVERILERNSFGAATRIEGANGVISTGTYDALGREISRTNNVASADTVTTEYLTCAEVSPGCPLGANIQYAIKKSAQNGGTGIEYFDSLGRAVRSASIDFNGLWVYTATEFDYQSRPVRVSQPYYNSPQHWSSTEYDLLGRTLSITVPASEQPFAVSRIEYDGLTSTTYNPDGQTKRSTTNTFGELIKVEDNVHDTENDYAYIRYAYNTEGNLTTTTVHKAEGGTIQTVLGYGRLGRKESMDDPDKGHWDYRYNAFGELIYQQDANLQVVRNTYDKIGRVTSRTDYKAPLAGQSEGAIEQVTHWYFDGATDDPGVTIANAIGQTTAVVMSRGVDHASCDNDSVQYCQYPSFDEFGRQIGTTTYVNSDNIDATPREVFTSSQSFSLITGRVDITHDVMHNLLRDDGIDIVSGSQAHYDSNGFLTHTTDLQDSSIELYRTVKTNVRGQVTEAEVGSYGRTLYYNDITGKLEKQIAYVGGLVSLSEAPDAFTIQHLTYEWDIVGNLKSRKKQSSLRDNGSNSANQDLGEAFCYDSLNRLVKTFIGSTSQSSCGTLSEADQDQRFDSIGNITYKSDVGNYSYDASRPHAVSSTTNGVSYFYDNNGNMTSDTDRTLEYSTFDKPVSITKGAHTSTFEYGPSRNRYLHTESNTGIDEKNTTTLYIGNVERLTFSDGSMEWRKSVAGGLRTYTTDASYNVDGDAVQRYIFKDHLGSIDVIADAYGNSEQRMSFNAWGERRKQTTTYTPMTVLELFNANTDITSRGYTSHEMLDELGLIHMNGRIYDAKLARFVQADPFIQAATDVQMYNRYSYVRNNPMNATDPSGFISWKDASGFSFHKKHIEQFGFVGAAVIPLVGYGGAFVTDATNRRLSQNDVYAQWAPTIVSIVTSYFCGPCSIGFSALATADINYYRTGDFNGAARAGAIAGASAAVTYGIGQATFVQGDFVGGMTAGSYASKVFLHAAFGGVMAKLQGGNFGNGFITAGFSAAASSAAPGGNGTGHSDAGAFAQGLVISALVGGTTSKLSGGKFANGARSGAIIYALNSAMEKDWSGGDAKAIAAMDELETTLIKRAASTDGPIDLSVDELNILYEGHYSKIKGESRRDEMFGDWDTPSIDGHFSGGVADTIFRNELLTGRQFNINGNIVLGGNINYVGVGMLAAHYGPNGYQSIPGIVVMHNFRQIWHNQSGGWRNLEDIGPGINWALTGADQYYRRSN